MVRGRRNRENRGTRYLCWWGKWAFHSQCVPKWLATEYPEMAGNLAENVDASVDERVVFDSLRDLLYYPVREEGAFHVVGVCVEVVVA